MNIWEFQKEQLRKHIANDPSNFYTYSKEHLSLAFPLVNENEIKIKEKEASEAKWKTKAGFDTLNKKTNFNAHPKQPPQSVMDDLKIPFVQQKQETKQSQKAAVYRPSDHGKEDFYSKVKSKNQTFSDPSYFNTVFISGDDMVKEMAELKQKEKEDFEKKVVVANQHFFVNTRVAASHQIDKHASMRQDPINKVGLRLGQKKLKELTARNILATKGLSDVPISSFSQEQYIMNEGVVKPMKAKLDSTKTPINRLLGSQETKDFVRYTKPNVSDKTVKWSPKIEPIKADEKVGVKWGK